MRSLNLPCLGLAGLASVMILTAASVSGQFVHPTIDPASLARGSKLYASSCARCHGPDARGTETAPDLIRSVVVLHDRQNSLHGAELEHVLETGPDHNFHFDKDQQSDLSQFLAQSINKTLRSGYSNEPTQLLTGDKEAGKAFFNGAGGCAKCHSVTGDLAGIGKRYEPALLQQKFLFPNSGPRGGRSAPKVKKVQVTVTLPSGKSSTGSLVHIDDFNVAFRDDQGVYHSFERTNGTKVQTVDPYAAHVELLDRYTDADIHNLTTYLETLK